MAASVDVYIYVSVSVFVAVVVCVCVCSLPSSNLAAATVALFTSICLHIRKSLPLHNFFQFLMEFIFIANTAISVQGDRER